MQTRNYTVRLFNSQTDIDVIMIGIYDDSEENSLMCMMSAVDLNLVLLCVTAATRLITENNARTGGGLCNVKYSSEIPGMIDKIVQHLAPQTLNSATNRLDVS